MRVTNECETGLFQIPLFIISVPVRFEIEIQISVYAILISYFEIKIDISAFKYRKISVKQFK